VGTFWNHCHATKLQPTLLTKPWYQKMVLFSRKEFHLDIREQVENDSNIPFDSNLHPSYTNVSHLRAGKMYTLLDPLSSLGVPFREIKTQSSSLVPSQVPCSPILFLCLLRLLHPCIYISRHSYFSGGCFRPQRKALINSPHFGMASAIHLPSSTCRSSHFLSEIPQWQESWRYELPAPLPARKNPERIGEFGTA
jgi:hypothetical protein